MVKRTIKQKKPSRHHWFLLSVFVVILLLAVAAFVLQRSANIKTIAGEAFRQTKQLASTEDQIKVALAVQEGKKTEFFPCPDSLAPASEQHWKLEAGWTWDVLLNRDASCHDHRIVCYYGISNNELNTEKVLTYKDLPGVENCERSISKVGCDCDLK